MRRNFLAFGSLSFETLRELTSHNIVCVLIAARFSKICLAYFAAFSCLTIVVLNRSQTNNSTYKSELTPWHEFVFTVQILARSRDMGCMSAFVPNEIGTLKPSFRIAIPDIRWPYHLQCCGETGCDFVLHFWFIGLTRTTRIHSSEV